MVNILKEINDDLGKKSICEDGDLTPWGKTRSAAFKYYFNCRRG